jgi:uncharacterized membrane protein
MEPISKVNLERLTNGIFAFTMTLMVRNIQTPAAGTVETAAALDNYLFTIFFAVTDFIGAFIILGMFWLFYFQIFHRMKRFDSGFIYIHFVALMVVVFVPFTESFATQGEGVRIAEILFQVNYLILAILLICEWYYARSHPSLLVPELTDAEASFLSKKYLVPFVVAMIGIGFIVADIGYIDLLYMLPFVIIVIFFRHPPEGDATAGQA